jgi:hypothetical protein
MNEKAINALEELYWYTLTHCDKRQLTYKYLEKMSLKTRERLKELTIKDLNLCRLDLF